jgi:hypothetical protein
MRLLVSEKERAITLRKQGRSYRDILVEVPVAKSTLSEWLKDLPLTEAEKGYLKTRLDTNISRGRIKAATANRQRKLERDSVIYRLAEQEFHQYMSDPFFFVGISLYWAEGAKRNWGFAFTNSDYKMVRVMVSWIERYLGVSRKNLRARLYTHKPFAHEFQEVYWSRKTLVPIENFRKTIYKPTGLLVKKRPDYKGCLRIEIPKGGYLQRMLCWENLLSKHYGGGN